MGRSVIAGARSMIPINRASARGMTGDKKSPNNKGLIKGVIGKYERLKTCPYCGRNLGKKPLSTHFNKSPNCFKKARDQAKINEKD